MLPKERFIIGCLVAEVLLPLPAYLLLPPRFDAPVLFGLSLNSLSWLVVLSCVIWAIGLYLSFGLRKKKKSFLFIHLGLSPVFLSFSYFLFAGIS